MTTLSIAFEVGIAFNHFVKYFLAMNIHLCQSLEGGCISLIKSSPHCLKRSSIQIGLRGVEPISASQRIFDIVGGPEDKNELLRIVQANRILLSISYEWWSSSYSTPHKCHYGNHQSPFEFMLLPNVKVKFQQGLSSIFSYWI